MKKAIQYSILVCLLSWAVYGIAILAAGETLRQNQVLMTLFKSAYMFLPLVCALVMMSIRKEKLDIKSSLRLNLSWKWFFAILCPILAVGLSILVSGLMPGVKIHYGADQIIQMNGLDEATAEALRAQLAAIPPFVLIVMTVIESIVAGATINAVFAFGEEFGWRGYMVDSLKGVSFFKAALLIGLVWGIWHAPLILEGHNYPQHPVAGVAMMCLFTLLVGVIELYFRVVTGSVVLAACIHGTVNALAGLVILFVVGGNDLTIGLSGAAGIVSLSIICIAIYVYDSYIGKQKVMSSNI